MLIRLAPSLASLHPGDFAFSSPENRAGAIRELLTASACREVEAVGQEACRAATTLIEKVVEWMADDADAAANLASVTHHRTG